MKEPTTEERARELYRKVMLGVECWYGEDEICKVIAYRLAAEREAGRKEDRWTPCTERLPDHANRVLVCWLEEGYYEWDHAYHEHGHWWNEAEESVLTAQPTHWKDGPQPPQYKEGEQVLGGLEDAQREAGDGGK